MRKDLRAGAVALAALLATPAAAQQGAPSPPAAGTPAPPPAAPSAGGPGGPGFIAAQQPEETLASDLIGTPVHNAEGQSLGDINDALLDADGRLKAVVVGVGGFLEIGERDVAVPWEAVDMSRGEDRDLVLRLDVGREQLEGAPEFESVEERRLAEEAARAAQTPPPTGTGIGGGGAVAPAPVPGAGPPAPAQ
jgi:sporulation protein YlmC with PRC-barrel domain